MPVTPNPTADPSRKSGRSLRDFWNRVTDGLKVSELWGEFKSEAKATYGFYSKDVDWEGSGREKSKFKRWLHSAWALFQALLMKLTPARRVLLLAAVVLIIVRNDNFDYSFLGAVILFLLLALELADRVTMKRDLEIAS